jgi:hypothetical protein
MWTKEIWQQTKAKKLLIQQTFVLVSSHISAEQRKKPYNKLGYDVPTAFSNNLQ